MTQEKHEGMSHMMDKAQDTAGGMLGVAKAKSIGSHDAEAFVKSAAIGDMYEIAAGRIALKRSRNAEVRQAAEKMIHDHTTNTHQMRSALRMNEARGIKVPPKEMDSRRKTMIEHLEAAPDDKFDAAYLDQQVLAHKETLELMEGYRDSGDNPQLRSLAMGAAPVVRRHLDKMEELKQAA